MSGKYRTIVVDPPWPYEAFATLRGSCTRREVREGWRDSVSMVRDAPLPYKAMDIAATSDLPIATFADRDCRLFLWTTQRFIADAFFLLGEWGFHYRQTLVWHKTSSFSPFGGSVAPNDVEFVLVARRGFPPVSSRAKSCVLATPGFAGRRKASGYGPVKHSQKPEAFLDLVEQISPGPYLELFARRARFGWDYWGDESLQTVELEGAA